MDNHTPNMSRAMIYSLKYTVNFFVCVNVYIAADEVIVSENTWQLLLKDKDILRCNRYFKIHDHLGVVTC